ncbi:hypothetical protein OIM90_14955 [Streptomyces sp. AD16]|nr:hypothetical protein OIM90_14955 [Streptomyces sp. AD16]
MIAGSGRRGRVRLLRQQGPVGAVLPVPRGTATAAGLALDIRASGPWTATLLATAHTRDLGPSAEGTGPDILTKETRSRLVVLHHQGPGPFRVRRLYRDFRPGPVLAEGRGRPGWSWGAGGVPPPGGGVRGLEAGGHGGVAAGVARPAPRPGRSPIGLERRPDCEGRGAFAGYPGPVPPHPRAGGTANPYSPSGV